MRAPLLLTCTAVAMGALDALARAGGRRGNAFTAFLVAAALSVWWAYGVFNAKTRWATLKWTAVALSGFAILILPAALVMRAGGKW
jgi:hypothetical protein